MLEYFGSEIHTGPVSMQQYILFVHSILGCDTTFHIHGFGKGVGLKFVRTNENFQKQAKKFGNASSTKADITCRGKQTVVCLYKGKSDEKLDVLRRQRFQQKVSSSKVFVRHGPPFHKT